MESKDSKRQHESPREQHLSKDGALAIIRKCITCGRIRIIPYFRKRMADRLFSMVDVERIIRSGAIYDAPEYCTKHGNWKYRVRAQIEGVILEVVIAVDQDEDLDLQPLAIPITGYWTGEGTADGKRSDGEAKGYRRKANKTIR